MGGLDDLPLNSATRSTYVCLLDELGEHRKARLAYDQGALEIMAPYFGHEWLNRLLADIITALAFGKHLSIEQAGSTTFRREDMARGFEADSSCYVGNQVVAMRGRERIDLQVDLPPTLVVEIDLTHPSLDKFPIYAALGVTEVWRYDGQHMWFYRLGSQGYAPVETNAVLPGITTQDIERFIETGRDTGRQVLFDEVRAWASR